MLLFCKCRVPKTCSVATSEFSGSRSWTIQAWPNLAASAAFNVKAWPLGYCNMTAFVNSALCAFLVKVWRCRCWRQKPPAAVPAGQVLLTVVVCAFNSSKKWHMCLRSIIIAFRPWCAFNMATEKEETTKNSRAKCINARCSFHIRQCRQFGWQGEGSGLSKLV